MHLNPNKAATSSKTRNLKDLSLTTKVKYFLLAVFCRCTLKIVPFTWNALVTFLSLTFFSG